MKLFLSKLMLFLVLVIVLQNSVGHFFPYPTPDSVTKLQHFQQRGVNLIYFGDSTTTWYSKYDTDLRSMPEMLNSLVKKNYTVKGIAHNAYEPFMYDQYTNYMIKTAYYPQVIIVPINLRAFSPSWDARPQNQFTDETLYLRFHDSPFAPFLTFLLNIGLTDINRVYDNIYNFGPIYDGDKIVGTGKSFEDKIKDATLTDDQVATMFQLFYLGRIHPNHRNIKALSTIADRYRNTKTSVIFYVTPIDYQTGEKYFGKRFDRQMQENIQTINEELHKHHAIVINLAYTQPTKNFTWHEVTYVNEHLNEKGRLFVASKLAEKIEHTQTYTKIK